MLDFFAEVLTLVHGLADPLVRALLRTSFPDWAGLFVLLTFFVGALALCVTFAIKRNPAGMLSCAVVCFFAFAGVYVFLSGPVWRAERDAALLRTFLTDSTKQVAIKYGGVKITVDPHPVVTQTVLFGDTLSYTTFSSPAELWMPWKNAQRASAVLARSSNVAERTAGMRLAAAR